MKAVAYQSCQPASESSALIDIELPKPVATQGDLLVRVEAISVNPVDTKIRQAVAPNNGEYKVLGWDAAGVVEQVGSPDSMFKAGDKVWYAGDLNRSGSNAQYHLVDERIVAHMPRRLDFADAAAMPLTAITAWEILFDRLACTADSRGNLLVIGAAGGVGSMLIQLAKRLTRLNVIATASRQETLEWTKQLGADLVINHQHDMAEQLAQHNISDVQYIASLTHTGDHLAAYQTLIAPQGKIAVIDDPKQLDIMPFKRKSVSVHWEFMFTRSMFQTADIRKQHELLTQVADLIDIGQITTTSRQNLGKINAANLLQAHRLIESGTTIGKLVLSGF